MAAEQNFFGINPQLIDPDNGDYRVAEGSPAEGIGCQTFLDEPLVINTLKSGSKQYYNIVRDQLEVFGEISENTIWSADTIRVAGDIVVNNGITLQIDAGTTILFDDFFKLEIRGTIRAEGSSGAHIIFASTYGDYYSPGEDLIGAWQGLVFNETSALNDESKISFCEFRNCKSLGMELPGSVFTLYNFSKLIIETSIFSQNYAEYGGAVYCYKNSNPLIISNLFTDNVGLFNSSVLYSGYSYPEIYNNTIVENSILNEDIFWETGTIQCFISKPKFKNNIIRDNECLFFEDKEILLNKDFYTFNNNIEGYENINGNFPDDPLFSYYPEVYSLQVNSPCVDTGIMDLTYFPELDLAGETRVYNQNIDIGCYEYQPDTEQENSEVNSLVNDLENYPNPFNPETNISFSLREKSFVELVVYDVRGRLVKILLEKELGRGKHNIVWNGRDTAGVWCSSGIYFYKIKAGDMHQCERMVLLK